MNPLRNPEGLQLHIERRFGTDDVVLYLWCRLGPGQKRLYKFDMRMEHITVAPGDMLPPSLVLPGDGGLGPEFLQAFAAALQDMGMLPPTSAEAAELRATKAHLDDRGEVNERLLDMIETLIERDAP